MDEFKLNKEINHVAFIMDGNGRWAKKRFLARTKGHKEALNRVIEIVRFAKKIGIKAVTLFAFSTENWNRPEDEINKLFEYLDEFFDKYIDEFIESKINIRVSGDISKLPLHSQKTLQKSLQLTENFNEFCFNICLNYGGRQEIVEAAKQIALDYKNDDLALEELNIKSFSNYLYTKDLPEVDLTIRTSGEVRLSNFLLYQLAYSELIFTPTYWPDFTVEEFKKCLKEFEKRDRRFGSIKE